jgi:hypothetical protein
MPLLVSPDVMQTSMVRTPVAGPEPANTLVYLSGIAPGLRGPAPLGTWTRMDVRFRTQFRLDGYEQKHHERHQQNTIVSATAMLRLLNTTTDLSFTFAADAIEPFLDLDGTLGFTIAYAHHVDDEAVFGPSVTSVFSAAVSAYVLCYEPRTDPPPAGWQFGRWAQAVEVPAAAKGLRWSTDAIAEPSSSVSRHSKATRRHSLSEGDDCPA